MNKLTGLLLFVVFFLGFRNISNGQHSNIIIFTENGERFSVILNGVIQNPTPETNVKVTDLPAPTYKLKVIFEDQGLPSLEKTLMPGKDLEMTYCIKKNNKNQYVIRFQNQVKISQAGVPVESQRVIPYSALPPSASTSVVQNQTTMTTVNNVNISGGSVNINVSAEANTTQTANGHDHYVMPGYSGRIGCPYPITDLDFDQVKKTISEKSFEESKLQIAKQVTSSNCLFASEVKEIMELFSFEKTRLDFAKFAYSYTYDISNYYKVNDAFSFESSIRELNSYIDGKIKK